MMFYQTNLIYVNFISFVEKGEFERKVLQIHIPNG